MNYLYDYIVIDKSEQTGHHFLSLLNLLQYIGLPINTKKVKIHSGIALEQILMLKF